MRLCARRPERVVASPAPGPAPAPAPGLRAYLARSSARRAGFVGRAGPGLPRHCWRDRGYLQQGTDPARGPSNSCAPEVLLHFLTITGVDPWNAGVDQQSSKRVAWLAWDGIEARRQGLVLRGLGIPSIGVHSPSG
jgi:hypothetical protein